MACCCTAQSTEVESVVVAPTESLQSPTETKTVVGAFEDPAAVPPVEKVSGPPIEKVLEPAPEKVLEPEQATPAQMTVKITKQQGEQLGLTLVSLTDSIMFVQSVVAGGAVAAHNQAHGDSISAGDHIISVNGVAGSEKAKIIELLQNESNFEIVVQKCNEVTLTIPKDGKLGLDLRYEQEREYIQVTRLVEGSVTKYNLTAAAGKQFKVPSRIVSVDGTSGSAPELLKKIHAAGSTITMIVSQTVE